MAAALDDNIQKQLSGRTLQAVSFALGSEEYGVDIAQVQEISRMVATTRVLRSPQFIKGVINLRGQLIPLIDLRTRFGMDRSQRTNHTRIVVLVCSAISEIVPTIVPMRSLCG